jgi:sugar transferase (PEP-CTERM/EpsH1 system associated)
MSGEILFLSHRIPFPPDRGDKIRSHHVLKALARIAPVHVACFADSEHDWQEMGELAELAASHCLVARRKSLPLAGIEALMRREPVSLAAFHHQAIERFVGEVLASHRIETIYVFSGQMGQYIPESFGGRVVVDLVDVDSAKYEAYSERSKWPMGWIEAREGRLLRSFEERLVRRAERCLLISEEEASLFRARLSNPAGAQISVLRNGIDVAAYDPRAVAPAPALDEAQGPHIVFTGQMDYAPNIVAARRVIEHILPAIRQHFPYAQFHVVGRAPGNELQRFDWKDGVRIWGEVPDVKPYLAAADIVTVPLEIARGVQNKVLEAMAMACPIVLTSGAATGIGAENGTHFAIEDGTEAITARIHSLLVNRGAAQAMGQAARRFVVERRSWESMLAGLPNIVGRGLAGGGTLHAA